MFLKLINFKEKNLRKKTKKIYFFNKKTLFLIKNMIKIMYFNKGIGLSSIQLNIYKKIIIIDISNKKNKLLVMINPKIIKNSNYFTLSTEGCLSIKNIFISLPRPDKIFIFYINEFNKRKKKFFSNILSRCIQHEIDHLFGIIIIDYFNKNIL